MTDPIAKGRCSDCGAPVAIRMSGRYAVWRCNGELGDAQCGARHTFGMPATRRIAKGQNPPVSPAMGQRKDDEDDENGFRLW